MHDLDLRKYREVWTDLNRKLHAVGAAGGPGAALHALRLQQLAQGFIRDDLRSMLRLIFPDPMRPERYFAAQFNPRRAQRFAGAGRHEPPPGAISVNNGCFLCPQNIQWQQEGVELGQDIELNGHDYIAWMNPYPLLPCHAVIATRDHLPQAWRHNGSGCSKSLASVINDLARLAARLPGWIGFYNGEGAGASIPHHFHYQFLERPADYGPYPLELAAAGACVAGPEVRDMYPLDFACWRGTTKEVAHAATGWLETWITRPGTALLTANVIAVAGDSPDQISLYFVPRDPRNSRSPEMTGLIGGLEVLGELVFCTDDERQRLVRGEVDYAAVERILRSVAAPL